MKYKTLDSFDFKGKRVLVRVDLNSEIRNKKIVLSKRIIAPVKTIQELLRKKAKVVLLAHQGRLGSSDFTSLKQHAALLSRFVKVKFVDDVMGNNAITAIRALKEGECILLDNVRSVDDELHPGKRNNLLNALSPLFDIYVNDAFSVSHREQTSVTEFPKVLPSCIGRVMQDELEHIAKLDLKECTFILGGAKIKDVSLLMNKKHVLTTGVPAIVCLLAKGNDLGKENRRKKDVDEMIRKEVKHIIVPKDLAVNRHGKRIELALEEFPSQYPVFDIGNMTIQEYSMIIAKSKSVFFKGTAGYAEIKGFENGTKGLLKAIERSRAFSVIAGGHSSTALDRFKIDRKKIGYVSLSGGALVHYLAGKKLPGLEALK